MEKPAAVTKITFGKYYQNHVCNLKKFTVSGSLHDDQDNMMELLQRYINRGYYTAVRRYEFYLRVVKSIFYERAQRVSKILFSPREDKIHIFKPPCNALFII